MAQTPEDIEQMTTALVKELVDDPEAVSSSTEFEDGTVTVTYDVAADDIGKVIGRQGRIIKSIRTIARAAGSQGDMHVEVEVNG